MTSAFKQQFKKLFRENRTDFIFIVILMVVAGFIQASSILGLMPIVDFVINKDLESANQITKFVASLISRIYLPVNIFTLGLFYLFLVLFRSGVLAFQYYVTSKVHFKVMNQIIFQEYESIINASWRFFGAKKYGTLANTVVKETKNAGLAFEAMATMAVAMIITCFYIILATIISWQLILITLFLTVVVAAPTFLVGKYIYRIREIHTNAGNNFQGLVYDALNALKLIIGFSRRKETITGIKSTIETLAKTSVQFVMIRVFGNMLGEPLGLLLVVVSVFFGLNILKLEVSEMFVFLYAVNRMAQQVQIIIGQRNEFKAAEPSLQQIYSIKNEADKLKESEGGKKLGMFTEKIAFENVSFSYDGNKQVLDNISFTIPKGNMAAIVGPSGAGKSTLIDMIMGFYFAGSGSILVDDMSICEINLHSWRNTIGYIPQSAYLFNATLRENLLWAKKDATNEEVEQACELANATEFITTLDRKYDTILGERGVRLSGGQAQRVCLARALIKKPEILILDEATSSLDSHSERMIQKSIEYLSSKITIISIAHRLSTIKKANLIYHIEAGRIVEKGTFKELISLKDGFFSKAASCQGIYG
ncbi:MAG: ABC transporter ATP-binding protein [Candidatus Omnitrophota bacterium]